MRGLAIRHASRLDALCPAARSMVGPRRGAVPHLSDGWSTRSARCHVKEHLYVQPIIFAYSICTYGVRAQSTEVTKALLALGVCLVQSRTACLQLLVWRPSLSAFWWQNGRRTLMVHVEGIEEGK